jgi:hypothetical protein
MSTDSCDDNSGDGNKDTSASNDAQAKRQALARALARLLYYRWRQESELLAGGVYRDPIDAALREGV